VAVNDPLAWRDNAVTESTFGIILADMNDGLTAAVETLYVVFGRYPLPDHVDFCGHCIAEQEVADLHRTPLRQVSVEQMGLLLWNTASTWGDQEYFNHFLPRLLELVAAGQMNDSSYPVTLPGRLAEPWQRGNDEERAAVDGFARAWWQQTMSTSPSACEPFDVFDTILDCGQDPQRYLDDWPVQAGEPAARQLTYLVDGLLPGLGADRPFSPTVNGWLLGPFPIGFLRQSLTAASEPAAATDLSTTLDHLQLCRQAHAADTVDAD
jgi:hypothetical protein